MELEISRKIAGSSFKGRSAAYSSAIDAANQLSGREMAQDEYKY